MRDGVFGELTKSVINQLLIEVGITPLQREIVYLLERLDPLTAGDVAIALGMQENHAATELLRLMRWGIVDRRKADNAHSRAYLYFLVNY